MKRKLALYLSVFMVLVMVYGGLQRPGMVGAGTVTVASGAANSHFLDTGPGSGFKLGSHASWENHGLLQHRYVHEVEVLVALAPYAATANMPGAAMQVQNIAGQTVSSLTLDVKLQNATFANRSHWFEYAPYGNRDVPTESGTNFANGNNIGYLSTWGSSIYVGRDTIFYGQNTPGRVVGQEGLTRLSYGLIQYSYMPGNFAQLDIRGTGVDFRDAGYSFGDDIKYVLISFFILQTGVNAPIITFENSGVTIEAFNVPTTHHHPTITVGSQQGPMYPHPALPTVSFPVTTWNMPDGVYYITFLGNMGVFGDMDNPLSRINVIAPPTLTVRNNTALLTLTGSNAMVQGTYEMYLKLSTHPWGGHSAYSNPFTLTIDGLILSYHSHSEYFRDPGGNNDQNRNNFIGNDQHIPPSPHVNIQVHQYSSRSTVNIHTSGGNNSATINTNDLRGIFNAEADLEVSTPNNSAGITLSTQAMKDAGINERALHVSVNPVNVNNPSGHVAMGIASANGTVLTAASFTVTQGGSSITNFNTPITLTMSVAGHDLSPDEIGDLVGVRFNADGTTTELPGTYDPATQTFSFLTNRLSTYGVMIANRLTQAPPEVADIPMSFVVTGRLPQRLELTIGSWGYRHNGVYKYLHAQPEIIDNQTMVPLRVIAEVLGAGLTWEAETQTAVVSLDGQTLRVDTHTQAINRNGSLLVPLRYVGEFFGCRFDFDEATGKIFMEK
jgi:hypothetical protein